MSTESDQSKQDISRAGPLPRYSINQYVKHAGSIKQINEWLLEDYRKQLNAHQCQSREKDRLLKEKTQQLTEKETQLSLAKQELSQLKDVSLVQFSLNLLSALLSGLGINFVTSTPSLEAGWMMIGAAVLIQCISFIMLYLARSRKYD
ncbi:hypothetical protein KSF_088960 [Reticulibacter mediterranei]|uniref:Uncharacterized protein n=1 Tax=Reticulibacter mediterranei TaxID=2778369 RepID=A0A8J3IUM5_9CHLR|nr:hypothetical protein [Reticulibacter mediterranei]GHO98848.1 hypothetical protein KSF_088960 [Reticulibacter mediterranei]